MTPAALPPVVAAHASAGLLPPEPTLRAAWTQWSLEPVPLLGVLVAGMLYLVGVARLRRRGDPWPWWRSALFMGPGLGSLLVATQSFLAVYDHVLISVHMVQHMALGMLAPIFLALGAPLTLALRTLPPRPRRLLLAALASRPARVLTFPLVAMAIFVVTPWVLYYTGWYEATLRSAVLHDLNHLHFVAVGCLWFWPLIGIDPMPARPPYPMRLLAVFATVPFHAWLGVSLMSSSAVLAEAWYAELDRPWGPSPLADQRLAGGILWTSGELVALGLLLVLFLSWARASEREAVREDRRLDRLEARAGPGTASAEGNAQIDR